MIRKAKLSEIEEIISITRACGANMASNGIFQWNDFYPNRDAFVTDVARNELYVLSFENTIIGCMVISSEKDEEYNEIDWLSNDGNNYYIHRLAVHPSFQKKGHAKRLMDFAEALARENNIESVRLDTFSQNTRNQKFYDTRGYTRLGVIFFPKQSEHPFYCYELILSNN